MAPSVWTQQAAMDGTLKTSDFHPPMRKSTHPSKTLPPVRPSPALGFESRVLEDGRTLFEKDWAIPMRDGVKLYGDLYRPIDSITTKTPTIVLFSPFGKHGAVPRELYKNMDVDFSRLSKYTLWELPDPYLWCPEYQYSLLVVDARATWNSEGDAAFYFSPEEGRDGYDIVDWVAKQTWSTGKIGWGAVSYFAMSAYQVAAQKPPHLAAIMPWEAISDIYREVNTIGGIPSVPFQHFWMRLAGNGLATSEDAATACLEDPLFGPAWQSKVVDWTKIDIPAFSVTSWLNVSLHLRGTIAAWKAFSSKHKYLFVHAGKEWSAYYSDDGIRRQKAFWDRFLKDTPTEVDNWPNVEIQVRTTVESHESRGETQWPPARAVLTPLLLGEKTLRLRGSASDIPQAYASYTSHYVNNDASSVSFDHVFASRTEITGDSCAKLYIQAMDYPDADLYLGVQKMDKSGKEVNFYSPTMKTDASAAHGWLRISHREKDPEASRPERPVHLHQRRQWIGPNDIVEVEVEIWPTSTVWEAGETLRLTIQGHPFWNDESKIVNRSANRHSFGEVRVWFGGDYPSQLLVPVVET